MLLLKSFASERSVDDASRPEEQDSHLDDPMAVFTFIAHQGFNHPNTRTYVRLLGPCFKTGE
jgi:hypothetical protein